MSDKPFVSVAPAEILATPTEIPQSRPEAPLGATATLTVAETRAHHKYSPSTLESLSACALYTSRTDQKEHARTTAGTRAHNSADTETDDERLSDEDAAAVAECLDYVANLKQDFTNDAKNFRELVERSHFEQGAVKVFLSPDLYEGAVSEINEPYLPIDDIVFPDANATTAGYADKIIFSFDKKRAHVADYKFGMWPVTHAKENLQGLAYALGVFKKWPEVEQITIHFLQPLLDARTSATIYRKDIPEHYFRICAVVARARLAREQNKDGEYAAATPHAPVCAFCGELGKCKKALAIAIRVGQKFSPLDIPDDLTPTKVYNDRDTSMAMTLSMVLATWAKAFRTVITNRVINGDADVPSGFQIVSQTKRELVDMAVYRKHAIKLIGAKAFETTLQTTFGAVEELVAEAAPRGMKGKIVAAFKKETEESGCVTRTLPITFLKAIPKKDTE
jgi:hypothetical protein